MKNKKGQEDGCRLVLVRYIQYTWRSISVYFLIFLSSFIMQRSWVRSQHPSVQWNLRGGRWSSAEYCTEKKIPPKNIKEKKNLLFRFRLVKPKIIGDFFVNSTEQLQRRTEASRSISIGVSNKKIKSAKYNLKIVRAASSVCIAYWCRVHLCANILAKELAIFTCFISISPSSFSYPSPPISIYISLAISVSINISISHEI